MGWGSGLKTFSHSFSHSLFSSIIHPSIHSHYSLICTHIPSFEHNSFNSTHSLIQTHIPSFAHIFPHSHTYSLICTHAPSLAHIFTFSLLQGGFDYKRAMVDTHILAKHLSDRILSHVMPLPILFIWMQYYIKTNSFPYLMIFFKILVSQQYHKESLL